MTIMLAFQSQYVDLLGVMVKLRTSLIQIGRFLPTSMPNDMDNSQLALHTPRILRFAALRYVYE